MSDKEPITPPFSGEDENAALPDVAAPQPGENTTQADGADAPPPMNAPARGPMDQTIPDVATGSTPVTRRDE